VAADDEVRPEPRTLWAVLHTESDGQRRTDYGRVVGWVDPRDGRAWRPLLLLDGASDPIVPDARVHSFGIFPTREQAENDQG
jgi:hypothetical protein